MRTLHLRHDVRLARADACVLAVHPGNAGGLEAFTVAALDALPIGPGATGERVVRTGTSRKDEDDDDLPLALHHGAKRGARYGTPPDAR